MELNNQILLYFDVINKNDRKYIKEEFIRLRTQKQPDGGLYEWTLLDKLNQRIYHRDYIKSEGRVSDIRVEIFSPQLFGEIGYPERFDISLKNISHSISNIRIISNYLVGDIKILKTEAGEKLRNFFESGTKTVFRPRLTGSVNDDSEVIIDQLFTFDAILKSEDSFNHLEDLYDSPHAGISKLGTGPGINKIIKNLYPEAKEPPIKDKINVVIDEHDYIDKFFLMGVGNDLSLKVDYDDVNHAAVDAMCDTVKYILENHWDKSIYGNYLMARLRKEWDEDKYIRQEYETFETYLKAYL